MESGPQNDGYRNLMVAVLVTQIEDYLYEKETHFEKAKDYIFRNDDESDNYVFGFNFIARYIDLDPDKLRENIKRHKVLLYRKGKIKKKKL